jgi:septal ring factor EnvC (AmiA/AmiB activator)
MSKLCDMSGLRSAAQLTHATIGVIFGREFGVKQACGRSDSAGLKAGALRCTHRSARKGFWQNVAGARKMLIGACVAVAGAAAAVGLAAAQGTVSPDEARKKLDADKGRLEASQRRSKELQADMDKLSAERQRINERLVDTARLIQQSEGQLNLIESRLGDLEAQEKQVRGSLAQRQGSISALLAAMQRMGRNPPPVMVTRREDALSMVRSAMLLAAAFPELRGQALGLAEQLNDLVRVMTGIRTEGDKLRAETTRLNEARTRLASLQETKRQSLSDRQQELENVRKAAADISRSVSDLSDLISKLDKEVADKTGLGTYEEQLAVAAAEQQRKTGVAPEKPGSSSEDRETSIVLAPTEERVAMLTPGRIKPAMPFTQARGLLPMPATGRRVLNFGDKTQYGSQSKGLVLETRHGAQIVSPSDGWIVYSGEFRSYGRLLIINAGGGYHILLAGLSQIDAQLGQFVLAGEPVGVMAAAPKAAQAKTQDNAPVLYIEFRKDQKPIDPDPWWMSDASRKVQG